MHMPCTYQAGAELSQAREGTAATLEATRAHRRHAEEDALILPPLGTPLHALASPHTRRQTEEYARTVKVEAERDRKAAEQAQRAFDDAKARGLEAATCVPRLQPRVFRLQPYAY